MIEFAREQHNAEGGGEAELQTDGVDGKGIAQQNHHQRRAERGNRVAVTAEKRRGQQENLHDAGPHHRGREAHHTHIKEQHTDGHAAENAAAMAGQHEGQQRHQEGAVKSRHGEEMGKPCPAQHGVVLVA